MRRFRESGREASTPQNDTLKKVCSCSRSTLENELYFMKVLAQTFT